MIHSPSRKAHHLPSRNTKDFSCRKKAQKAQKGYRDSNIFSKSVIRFRVFFAPFVPFCGKSNP
jgi:hypothetical protein